MVILVLANSLSTCPWLWGAASSADKLPPPTRAAVLMALLGIALIGLLFVVAILLGGHWVRRQGMLRRGPSVPPDRRPLQEGSLTSRRPETTNAPMSDTVAGGPADPSETVPL